MANIWREDSHPPLQSLAVKGSVADLTVSLAEKVLDWTPSQDERAIDPQSRYMRVYERGERYFNVSAYGPGMPQMTFVISKDFPVAVEGHYLSPLTVNESGLYDLLYAYLGESYSGRNLYPDEGVLFGDFALSKAGKPVFYVKDAVKASHVLVHVRSKSVLEGVDFPPLVHEKESRYHYFAVIPFDGAFKALAKKYAAQKEKFLAAAEPMLEELSALDPEYRIDVKDFNHIRIPCEEEGHEGEYVSCYRMASDFEVQEALKEVEKHLEKKRDEAAERAKLTAIGMDAGLLADLDMDHIEQLVLGSEHGLSAEDLEVIAVQRLRAYDAYHLDPHDIATWIPNESAIERSPMGFLRKQLENGVDRDVVAKCVELSAVYGYELSVLREYIAGRW